MNHIVRVMGRLRSQIFSHYGEATGAHGVDRIPLRPSQAVAFRRVPFLAGDRGTTTLESLQQPSDVGGRTRSNKQVYVCPHHPDLENPGVFLRCDASEKGAQEPGQSGVDERHAISRGPDDVTIDAIDHKRNLGRARPAAASFSRGAERIHAPVLASELAARPCQ